MRPPTGRSSRTRLSRYGPLRHALVSAEPSLAGALIVAFGSAEAREACKGDMDGRWFDFRRLMVQDYSPPAATPPHVPAAAAAPSLDAFFDSLK